MSLLIDRLFKGVSRSMTSIVRNMARSRSRQPWVEHSSSLSLEPLESRVLLANLLGREYFRASNVLIPGTTISSEVLTKLYDLGTDATITAQVSRIENLVDHQLFSDIDLEVFTESDHIISAHAGDFTELITVSAPAGTLQVSASTALTNSDLNDVLFHQNAGVVAIAADRAPGQLAPGSSTNFRADRGRDMGTLSTASTTLARDFIGYLDRSDQPGKDLIDTYFFDIPKSGSVQVRLDELVDDVAGGSVSANVGLYRDFDNDGVLASNEAIEARSGNTTTSVNFTRTNLAAARYAVVVSRLGVAVNDNAGGSNYRFRLNYSVPDNAGNSIVSARNIGELGGNTQGFADYLASNDTTDIYKFTTPAGQGGPFTFTASMFGVDSDSDFDLDFIRDINNNGAVDAGEILFSAAHRGLAGESILAAYPAPGTYFVRVSRISGEGPYSINFQNTNTDRGGNDLAHALNISRLFGRKFLSDSISSTDTVDFIKFNLPTVGTFRASFPATAAGTDADLALLDQNGAVLRNSDVRGIDGESLSRICTPGDYYVRISRIAGTPIYNATISIDTAGSTPGTALTLPTSGINAGTTEFVGAEDTTDFYRFDLTSPVQFNAFVQGTHDSVGLQIAFDANANNSIDTGEEFLKKTVGTALDRTSFNGVPGRYFLSVLRAGAAETDYLIDFRTAVIDNAGNSIGAARNIGTLGSTTKTFSDFVGDGAEPLLTDLEDFYRFTLGPNGPYTFLSSFTSITNVARMELVRDQNLNGILDVGVDDHEVLAFVINTATPGVPPPPIVATLSETGNYFLHVVRTLKQVNYTLQMTAFSQDLAGNSLAAAADLGVLDSPQQLVDSVRPNDLDDFRRFSVTAAGELLAKITETSPSSPSAFLEVIRDVDNDFVIDPGETLASTAALGVHDDVLNGVFLPSAGSYYVRVSGLGGTAIYSLLLSVSPQTPFLDTPFLISATTENRIQVERFDTGGEGVSYHDSTLDNSGNTPGFRGAENIDVDVSNTSDVDGGRRVTNTAPGEFLEYTLNVAQSGFFDFDARVSSPDLGASFHLAIDDISLSGPIAVPDTNGEDNMVTIAAASNVTLLAGPHILRLAIDTGTGVNNNFAGSFNFITIRPASAGTFELAPANSVVSAGEHANLSLAWTVPVGGWTVLKQVDLRLRDDLGRLIWIRFDEANRTFSLYNESNGKFGPAKKVGSNSVLSGPLADLYIGTTTVAAGGPSAPIVVFTFDLRFKASARGHYTIEAAASDDLGHNDPLAFAGTLNVV